MQLIITS